VISYEDLLEVFWREHDPHRESWSRQYMAAVFVAGEDQRRRAEASRDRVERETGRKVRTKILPAGPFTLAEAYHQKYYLRQVPTIARDYLAIYPRLREFVDSTAVARVNGYLGGHFERKPDAKELSRLGLGPEARAHLEGILSR
jgi:hypothetical protein